MAKDHGPSVKDDEKYEALRDEGMSKSKAAAIANSGDEASSRESRASAHIIRAKTPSPYRKLQSCSQ